MFRRLDPVLSYPVVISLMQSLGMTDRMKDDERIAEINWIVHEYNKFLSGLERECWNKSQQEIVSMAEKKLVADRYVPKNRKELLFSMYKKEMLMNLATETMLEAIYEDDVTETEGDEEYV